MMNPKSPDDKTPPFPFHPISTPYGNLELEELAAMMETTVDYLILEFLP